MMSDNDISDEDIWNYGSQANKPKRKTLGSRNNHTFKQIPSNIAQRSAVRNKTKKDHNKEQDVRKKSDSFKKTDKKVMQECKTKKQNFVEIKVENKKPNEQNGDKVIFQPPKSSSNFGYGVSDLDLQHSSTCNGATDLPISEIKDNGSQSQESKSSQISLTPHTPHSQTKRKMKKKTPDSVNKSRTPKRPPHEGFCPFCQMPFSILLIESPRWHTMECMDVPLIALEECPAELSCDNTIASHYRKFKHTLLTNHRAGIERKDEKNSENCNVGTVQSNDFDKGQERKRSPSYMEDHSSVPNSKRSKLSDDEQKDEMKQQNAKRQLFLEQEDEVNVCESDSDIFGSDDNEEDQSVDTKTDNGVESLTDTGELVGTEDSAESEREVSALLEDVFSDEGVDVPTVLEVATPVVENRYANTTDLRESEEQDIENAVEALTQNHCDISDSDENTCQSTQSSTWYNAGENDEENDTEFNDLISGIEFDDVMENESTPVINPPQSVHNEIVKKEESHLHNVQKQSSLLSFFLPNRTNKSVPQPTNSGTKSGNYLTSSLQKFTSYFTSSSSASSSTHSKHTTSNHTKQFGRGHSKTSGNETSSDSASYAGSRKPYRQCPFYKKMPGTPFTVDAFRYGSIPGCKVYFLTHFHYDHYGGLTKHFKHPIYCTKITANLVSLKIRTDKQYLHALALNTEYTIEGVKVTFLEANHCPGAVLILFKLPNGQVYLHTGDFRADQSMEEYPALKEIKINQLYLDTTYCDPQYAFPPQNDVITFAAKLAEDTAYARPNTLFVVGSYTIGKERIFLAIAEALNCKICVIRDKKNILDCIDDPATQRRLTLKPHEAKVHVLPMGKLRFDNLTSYLASLKPRFDNIVALEPTGWSYSNKVTSLENIKPKMKRENITIYGVPYSEHSSYTEMKRFVQFCRPERVLPTVNMGNPSSRKKMETLFKVWLEEVNKTPTKKMKQTGLNGWLSPSQKK